MRATGFGFSETSGLGGRAVCFVRSLAGRRVRSLAVVAMLASVGAKAALATVASVAGSWRRVAVKGVVLGRLAWVVIRRTRLEWL